MRQCVSECMSMDDAKQPNALLPNCNARVQTEAAPVHCARPLKMAHSRVRSPPLENSKPMVQLAYVHTSPAPGRSEAGDRGAGGLKKSTRWGCSKASPTSDMDKHMGGREGESERGECFRVCSLTQTHRHTDTPAHTHAPILPLHLPDMTPSSRVSWGQLTPVNARMEHSEMKQRSAWWAKQ